jgi:hypothetical protein
MSQRDKRGRLVCWCVGYWFPHRKTSGACDHSSRVDYYRAVRAGLPDDECMALLSAADLRRLFPIPGDN